MYESGTTPPKPRINPAASTPAASSTKPIPNEATPAKAAEEATSKNGNASDARPGKVLGEHKGFGLVQ